MIDAEVVWGRTDGAWWPGVGGSRQERASLHVEPPPRSVGTTNPRQARRFQFEPPALSPPLARACDVSLSLDLDAEAPPLPADAARSGGAPTTTRAALAAPPLAVPPPGVVTYGMADAISDRVARWASEAQRLGPGDVAALFVPSRPASVTLWLGFAKALSSSSSSSS